MPSRFGAARDVLQRALAARAFPAAVAEAGTSRQPLWREAFGRLTFDADARPAGEETIFDLASLTKVLATTALVMRHVERGRLALDDRVSRHLPRWRGADREDVTIRDLLAHSSGLPAHRPFYRELRGRDEFERAIVETPLEYSPRSKSIYSDLGFMLLGFILEDATPVPLHGADRSGSNSGVPAQFDAMLVQMGGIQELRFHPPDIWKGRTAPTQQNTIRGRLLIGEVDDDNTWALGGAAGQAGLFGTAASVGEYARHLLQVLDGRVGAFREETLATFIARQTDVPGSSRALGWDTMLPTSSCGTRLSPRAFGHTGFTGTSLWIDPERDRYAILLTNRVYPTPANEAIKQVRPAFHDAVAQEW
jgi:CubicO group peptidase (beta-lactamase class C family)